MDKSQPSVKGLLNDYVHGVVAWSSHSSYGRKLHTLISYMSVTRKIDTYIICTSWHDIMYFTDDHKSSVTPRLLANFWAETWLDHKYWWTGVQFCISVWTSMLQYGFWFYLSACITNCRTPLHNSVKQLVIRRLQVKTEWWVHANGYVTGVHCAILWPSNCVFYCSCFALLCSALSSKNLIMHSDL